MKLVGSAYHRGRFTTVEPSAAATERYYARLHGQFPRTVWVSGCSSWYLDDTGMPMVWPWSPGAHRRLMDRTPDPDNYVFDRYIDHRQE